MDGEVGEEGEGRGSPEEETQLGERGKFLRGNWGKFPGKIFGIIETLAPQNIQICQDSLIRLIVRHAIFINVLV